MWWPWLQVKLYRKGLAVSYYIIDDNEGVGVSRRSSPAMQSEVKMREKLIKPALKMLVIGLVCSISGVTVAQQQSSHHAMSFLVPTESDYRQTTNCEFSTALLDSLAQKTPAKELIIVIAHLGDGDTRPNLNERRLHNVRTYLTNYLTLGRREPNAVVVAGGERIKGNGSLEFYVSGKLYDTLRLRPNADLSLGECSHGPEIDPCSFPKQQKLFPCRSGTPTVIFHSKNPKSDR